MTANSVDHGLGDTIETSKLMFTAHDGISNRAAAMSITTSIPHRKGKPAPSIQRKRAPPQQQQLYLDFGQRNFGATVICGICGMLMVHGVDADVQRHASFCRNYVEGVPWTSASTCKPCFEWTLPDLRRNGEEKRLSTKRSRILRDRNVATSVPDRACIIEVLSCVDLPPRSCDLMIVRNVSHRMLGGIVFFSCRFDLRIERDIVKSGNCFIRLWIKNWDLCPILQRQ
jgi:hypothetical protein